MLAGCKKPNDPINIRLKGKSLSVIKRTIRGDWQLHYAYGGFTGHYRKDFNNSFICFKKSDTIIWLDSTWKRVDTEIHWTRILDFVEQNPDSVFLMSFHDTYGYPYSWIVDGIYNDTLLIYQDAYDGMIYHLTRKN